MQKFLFSLITLFVLFAFVMRTVRASEDSKGSNPAKNDGSPVKEEDDEDEDGSNKKKQDKADTSSKKGSTAASVLGLAASVITCISMCMAL